MVAVIYEVCTKRRFLRVIRQRQRRYDDLIAIPSGQVGMEAGGKVKKQELCRQYIHLSAKQASCWHAKLNWKLVDGIACWHWRCMAEKATGAATANWQACITFTWGGGKGCYSKGRHTTKRGCILSTWVQCKDSIQSVRTNVIKAR